MKPNTLSMLLFTFILIFSACSPAPVESPTETVPAPVMDGEGYYKLQIDDVQVEVGVGSPIPVYVNVSGSLPNTCAQVEYSEITRAGSSFMVQLSTIPGSREDCINDTLPFRMSIPLNIIDLPAGNYSVEVNGQHSDFRLESGNPSSSLQTDDMPVVKSDIQVDSVSIEVGVGSPIPVIAIVSGNLPLVCAQLGEVRLHRDGTTFFVRLVADLPAQSDCAEDTIAFRLEIPLNIVNLSDGPYEINVNGIIASFDPRATPATP